MKTKKKLLISVLLVAFVVISVVSIIAIVFAATQQTVKTTLNITYTAEDIDAKVSARMVYQTGTTEDMGSITFEAGNTTAQTGTLSPSGNVELSKDEQYVVFEYTFQNTGDKDFVATFDYTDTEDADKNMSFGYKGEADNYKENANAVLVLGGETKTYSVKVSIENLARDAHLSGDMAWDMTSNIVVATPATAQAVLDSNINGKTIVFDEGTYTNPLSLGASAETSTAYKFLENNWTAFGEEVAIENLDKNASVKYHYSRTIQNVTIAGTENAIINSSIFVAARSLSWVAEQYGMTVIDPMRKIITSNFIQDLKINNLHFTNLNFVNSANIMITSDSQLDVELKNISTTNCSFINEGNLVKTPAYVIANGFANEEKITNFTFKNNFVKGHYWGIQTYETNNHEIINNTFKNIEDSAICLRVGAAGDTNYTSGNIIIKGNTIDGCLGTLNEEEGVSGAYAITMQKCKNANIVIENNSFKNSLRIYENGDPSELLLIENLIGSKFSFVNNTYEYKLLENTSTEEDTTNFKITIK